MKRDLYTITTLSNLHVGSGDINFDIIDNQVQRDAITTLPTIHSSSLKGAFREASGEGNYTNYVFGPENSSNDSHQTGAFHFFEASLLARPVRSNKKPYFMATSVGVVENFLTFLEDFEMSIDAEVKSALEALSKVKVEDGKPLIFEKLDGVILEDTEAIANSLDVSDLEEFLGKNLALFSDKDFKELTLPVLARNYLEEGVSKNLWYEEVVPKKSKFYFAIAKPTNLDEADKQDKLDAFEKRFDNSSYVQFGGNKSIGYGYSKVEKVSV
jgi:CRISPR-associated protein Cmr4